MPSEELITQIIIISALVGGGIAVILTIVLSPITEFIFRAIKEFFHRLRLNWTIKQVDVTIKTETLELYGFNPETGTPLFRKVTDLSKEKIPEPSELSEK